MSTPIIFLDKDGTIVENIPYNVDTRKIKLMPGVLEGLEELKQLGFKFIVITNQSGVAQGFFDEESVKDVGRYLTHVFDAHHLPLLDFYYCPHHPKGTVERYKTHCLCRKPSAGLLWKAREEHLIDLNSSWLIGDILDDIECGRRAGCKTVFVDQGHETEWYLTSLRKPHVTVRNFREAAQAIKKSLQYEHMGSV